MVYFFLLVLKFSFLWSCLQLSVDVSIPEEVLNCDSSGLSENVEPQSIQATGGSGEPVSMVHDFLRMAETSFNALNL